MGTKAMTEKHNKSFMLDCEENIKGNSEHPYTYRVQPQGRHDYLCFVINRFYLFILEFTYKNYNSIIFIEP